MVMDMHNKNHSQVMATHQNLITDMATQLQNQSPQNLNLNLAMAIPHQNLVMDILLHSLSLAMDTPPPNPTLVMDIRRQSPIIPGMGTLLHSPSLGMGTLLHNHIPVTGTQRQNLSPVTGTLPQSLIQGMAIPL